MRLSCSDDIVSVQRMSQLLWSGKFVYCLLLFLLKPKWREFVCCRTESSNDFTRYLDDCVDISLIYSGTIFTPDPVVVFIGTLYIFKSEIAVSQPN